MSESKDTTSNEFTLTATPLSKEEERKAKKAAYMRDWRKANPEKTKAIAKAWRDANLDKAKAQQKASYEAYREARLAKVKAYREANRAKVLLAQKASYEANKEDRLVKGKAYREANKDKLKEWFKGHYQANRDSVLARVKNRHRANPGQKYGLTGKEYWGMVAACNGRCPCCKTPFSEILGKTTLPCVDHDHKKGQTREAVRGIVCHRCNMLLGHADDDPKILRACARHLERSIQ
jgi:hypothetical protein